MSVEKQSVVEKMAAHQDEMMQEVQKVQDRMAKSASGQKMMQASVAMAGTQAMNDLMALIGDQNVSEEERMLLAQYMGDMLKNDPAHGMVMYSDYLKSVAADPAYAGRKDYYTAVSGAAIAVDATTEYQDYVVAYAEFEADNSNEAKEARKATEDMQAKMRQWAGVDAV